MSLQNVPSGSRLHVVVIGACNSGKSSVANMITGQQAALVSSQAGTTTDPVRKTMELPGLGAAMITDTAGFDDSSPLGAQRVELTERALDAADIVLLLCGENEEYENLWLKKLEARKVPVVKVVNKIDLGRAVPADAIGVSASEGRGRTHLLDAMLRAMPASFDEPDLLRGLVGSGATVVLAMPQDAQAPKGRLILPQVQTIRALLDKGCNALCTTPSALRPCLDSLKGRPDLVITDSQVFKEVSTSIPEDVPLTSFSVLLAAFKGDIRYFVESAAKISTLGPGSRVLIAEACTHAPQTEDIGRVKIPAMLRKKAGAELEIEVVAGRDFPADLSRYDLVVHCGACMFNRRMVLSRVEQARRQGVAMTNYGITLAALTGILPRISF